LFYKYMKGGVGETIMGSVGAVAELVGKYLPDTAGKVDPHDIVVVVGALASKIPEWAKTNATWSDCKDEVLTFLEESKKTIPELAAISKETFEKIAEALFFLATALPALFSKKPAA
jgi:hypothetical protein